MAMNVHFPFASVAKIGKRYYWVIGAAVGDPYGEWRLLGCWRDGLTDTRMAAEFAIIEQISCGDGDSDSDFDLVVRAMLDRSSKPDKRTDEAVWFAALSLWLVSGQGLNLRPARIARDMYRTYHNKSNQDPGVRAAHPLVDEAAAMSDEKLRATSEQMLREALARRPKA